MYPLTLTKGERNAIDWIGCRYSHGDELCDALRAIKWSHAKGDEHYWDDDGDMSFDFTGSEHIAWLIRDLIYRDNLACFAPELQEKLFNWADKVI